MTTPAIQRVGHNVARREILAYNRTGAAKRRGQVAMIDVLGAQAETTSIAEGASGSVFENLTPVTQTGLDNGFPILVCLDDEVADNAIGRWLAEGYDQVMVLDDDTSTTDVDRGDPISMLVSESAVAVQAAANGDRYLGTALEDAAASGSSGDASLKWCIWQGGKFGYGFNLDA